MALRGERAGVEGNAARAAARSPCLWIKCHSAGQMPKVAGWRWKSTIRAAITNRRSIGIPLHTRGVMIKFLLSTVALTAFTTATFAADLPARKEAPTPYVAAPAVSWTGCYVGANVGAGWSSQNQNRVDQIGVGPAPIAYGSDTGSAVIGGGQIGCDYQFGAVVVGLQGQFDWGSLSASHGLPGFPTFSMQDTTSSLGSATARLGYAIMPNFLLYARGGFAFIADKDTLFLPGGAGISERASWNSTGWTLGAGAEWMFAPNWSIFAEYKYMGFGSSTIQFNAAPGLFPVGEHVRISQNVQSVMVGVNYHFNFGGPSAVVAKY